MVKYKTLNKGILKPINQRSKVTEKKVVLKTLPWTAL